MTIPGLQTAPDGLQLVRDLPLVTIQRPANTTAYSANQTWADSTTTPTAGGFVFSGAALSIGGGGNLIAAEFVTSLGTQLQGELWLFNQAVTAIADGATFSLSNGDAQKRVAVIPFNCTDSAGTPQTSYVTGVGGAFATVGSTNLFGLVKILNAPTPASGEVLSIRLHVSN